jgi:hypothetical protein
MFAIMGVGLFDHKGISEPNFESMGGALLCVFRIVTGDDWNEVISCFFFRMFVYIMSLTPSL